MTVETRAMKAAKGKSPNSKRKSPNSKAASPNGKAKSQKAKKFPPDFNDKFKEYVKEERDKSSQESVNDLKARFALTYVPHLKNKPLIQVEFTGNSTVKQVDVGYLFATKGTKNRNAQMKPFFCR